MITKRNAVSLSGSASRWRHGRHQVAMGKRHHRRAGSPVYRRATILADELWICHGNCCRTRKQRDAQAFHLPVRPLQRQRDGNPTVIRAGGGDAVLLSAGQAKRCESEASDGDNLVSCAAPRASALRIVDLVSPSPGKSTGPCLRPGDLGVIFEERYLIHEFTRLNVQT